MAYGTGRVHKIVKKNRKRLENTTYPYSTPINPPYSYDKLNKKTDSNTNLVIPPCFDTSIQNQHISASYASGGQNYVSSSELYQSTNHHGNTDSKDNDDS